MQLPPLSGRINDHNIIVYKQYVDDMFVIFKIQFIVEIESDSESISMTALWKWKLWVWFSTFRRTLTCLAFQQIFILAHWEDVCK